MKYAIAFALVTAVSVGIVNITAASVADSVDQSVSLTEQRMSAAGL
ncbi:hypothetical protein [Thioalkalivibrio sp. ALMg11]|nr:hypothetical protein [Thioalkalivibrio sp. ALMg11]